MGTGVHGDRGTWRLRDMGTGGQRDLEFRTCNLDRDL